MGPSIIHSQQPLEPFQSAELLKRIQNEYRNLKKLLQSYVCEPQDSSQFEIREKLRSRLERFRFNWEKVYRNVSSKQMDQRQLSKQVKQVTADFRKLEKEIREYQRRSRV